MIEAPGPEWIRNTGSLPERAKGKRVIVILANGNVSKPEGTTTAPPGWAANSLRWSKTDSPFDVEWWKPL